MTYGILIMRIGDTEVDLSLWGLVCLIPIFGAAAASNR